MKTTRCSLKKIITESRLSVKKSGSLIYPSVVEHVYPESQNPRSGSGYHRTLQAVQSLGVSFAIYLATHIAVALGIQHTDTPEEGSSPSGTSTEHSPLDLSDLPKEGLLGSGSFGTVWKVKWQGEFFALKISQDSSTCHEVEVAMGLVHPNVVSTLAHQETTGENSQLTQILMELCEKNLEQGAREKMFTCPRTGFLDWQRVREIMLCIAEGLEYVHSCGYVHLDLKPANIFLCRGTDGRTVAKIGDFGLSLDLQGKREVTVERPGTIIISAPETLDESTACAKSDVYSFGILLWMCITGRVPYSGMDIEDVIEFITEGILPSIDPSWPAWVTSLLKDCWATDPSSRPFSGELVTRLKMAPNTSCPPRRPPPGFERHKLAPPPGFGPGPSRKPEPSTNPENSRILAIMPERPPGF